MSPCNIWGIRAHNNYLSESQLKWVSRVLTGNLYGEVGREYPVEEIALKRKHEGTVRPESGECASALYRGPLSLQTLSCVLFHLSFPGILEVSVPLLIDSRQNRGSEHQVTRKASRG